MTKYISECHQAEMIVRGDSFGEGTNHYECTECGQPCNFIEAAPHTNQDTDKELFVCVDGWAHDFIGTKKGQKCGKCHGYLDELVEAWKNKAIASTLKRLEDKAELNVNQLSLPETSYELSMNPLEISAARFEAKKALSLIQSERGKYE